MAIRRSIRHTPSLATKNPKPTPSPVAATPKPTPSPTVVTPKPTPSPTVVTPKPTPSPTVVTPKPTPSPTVVTPKPTPSPVVTSPKPTPTLSPAVSHSAPTSNISNEYKSPAVANTKVSDLIALFENMLPTTTIPTDKTNTSPHQKEPALLSDFGQARLTGQLSPNTKDESGYDSMPGLIDMPSDWGQSQHQEPALLSDFGQARLTGQLSPNTEDESGYNSMPGLIDMPSDWGQSDISLEDGYDLAHTNNRGLLSNSAGIIDSPSEYHVKNVNTRLIENAGIDPSNYSSDFLSSQDVFLALNKKLNSLPANLSDEAIKKEMKSSVNILNFKYLQDKPLNFDTSLSDPNTLTTVINKLQQSLSEIPFASAETRLASMNLQDIQSTLEPGSLKSNTAMVKELDNLAKLANQKDAAPELKHMKSAVEGLRDHLKSDIAGQIKNDIKAQLAEHYQHLTKSGASDTSTFDLRFSLPAGPLLTIGVQGQNVSSFETGNNYDITQNNSKTGQLMLNFGVHGLVDAGVGFGARVDQKNVFGGIDKMLEFNADQVISQLVRAPLSKTANRDAYHAMTQLRDLVGDQNNARNHNDRLESDLKAMGWIQKSETLAQPDVHQKTKLDDRTEIRTRIRAEATVGTSDGLVGGAIRSDAENMVGVHNKRVPMLSAMLKTPELLENKQNAYGRTSEIEKLTRDVNTVIHEFPDAVNSRYMNSRTDFVQLATSTRETLKEKIQENFALLESYTSTVRNRDDNVSNKGSVELAYANVKQALTGDARDIDTQKKHDIEKSLGTKGRQQTLDALTTHHASYIKLYQDLDSASSAFTQAIPAEQKYSSTVTGLDLAGLDLAPTTYQPYKPDSQFNDAVASINNRFESPNMYLNDKKLTASQATKQATINSTHHNSRAELNVAGQRIVVEGKHTQLNNHPDITRDGKIDNYVLRGITELSASSIEGIVASIKNQAGEESALAVGKALLSITPDIGGRGEVNLEFEFKDDNLMYTRVNLANETVAGGALNITGLGGASLTGTSRHQEPIFEKIAAESLYYAQLQFNGLVKSERVSGDGDDWSKFAQEQSVPFAELMGKLSDPDSTPFKEMASIQMALTDKANNGKISEETMHTMNLAFDSLKTLAESIKNKAENDPDNLAKDPEFNKAIDDFRKVFKEYRKSVIDPAKTDRQDIVSEEGNNHLFKRSIIGGASHAAGVARDVIVGEVYRASDLIREH